MYKKITFLALSLFVFGSVGAYVLYVPPVQNTPPMKDTTQTALQPQTPQLPASQTLLVQQPTSIPHTTTQKTTTSGAQVYTPQLLAQHNSRSDCYLAINGKVYNVTPYLPYHPAGAQIITQRCGKEVTNLFARIHSNRAWDLLARYKVGSYTSVRVMPMTQVAYTLDDIQSALTKANPTANIVHVKPLPKGNGYVAKVVLHDGRMVEVHMDTNGTITNEEVTNSEPDWKLWNTDKDDQ